MDKERFNFCEYFAPGNGNGRRVGEIEVERRKALEELFKKK